MTGEALHLQAVTGSRADWGLLQWPLVELAASPRFRVTIAATGMHLAAAYGMTIKSVEQVGLPVTLRIPTLSSEDTAVDVARAVGSGIAQFSEAWAEAPPDAVMLLGDRFEIFAAATAAHIMRIPIVHLCGGDVTEGAFDDAMRHSISKMASLHFVSNQPAAARLARMGEQPERIHVVGSPGLDWINRTSIPDRKSVSEALGLDLTSPLILVTFHPVTADQVPSAAQMDAMLDALDRFSGDATFVFTAPNADPAGQELYRKLAAYAASHDRCCLRDSLGSPLYLGVLQAADVVVGNSSSGLYEAPSLGTPTVNIGRRQDGRLRAASVIDCPPQADSIERAIRKALSSAPSDGCNPYGDGHSSARIRKVMESIPDIPALGFKSFYDPVATPSGDVDGPANDG